MKVNILKENPSSWRAQGLLPCWRPGNYALFLPVPNLKTLSDPDSSRQIHLSQLTCVLVPLEAESVWAA